MWTNTEWRNAIQLSDAQVITTPYQHLLQLCGNTRAPALTTRIVYSSVRTHKATFNVSLNSKECFKHRLNITVGIHQSNDKLVAEFEFHCKSRHSTTSVNHCSTVVPLYKIVAIKTWRHYTERLISKLHSANSGQWSKIGRVHIT